MPNTLITGANGFVGAHAVAAAIAKGHNVTGCVRNKARGQELLDIHPEWKGKLSFVEVKDYAAPGEFDDIFKNGDFDYVLHVAAPVFGEGNMQFDRDFLKPNVEGQVAAKEFSKIKAIAVTGSINAVTLGDPEDIASRVMSTDAWLPLDAEDARKTDQPFVHYSVGKKLGEKAIWDFMEKEKPGFYVTVIRPTLIFGPPIQKISDIAKMNFSSDLFWTLMNGKTYKETPPTMFPSYIDVRDLVDMHLTALDTPEAANKQFIAGHVMIFDDIVQTLETLPELKGKLPKLNHESVPPLRLETEPGDKILHVKYRTKEQTFIDTAKKILELGAA